MRALPSHGAALKSEPLRRPSPLSTVETLRLCIEAEVPVRDQVDDVSACGLALICAYKEAIEEMVPCSRRDTIALSRVIHALRVPSAAPAIVSTSLNLIADL